MDRLKLCRRDHQGRYRQDYGPRDRQIRQRRRSHRRAYHQRRHFFVNNKYVKFRFSSGPRHMALSLMFHTLDFVEISRTCWRRVRLSKSRSPISRHPLMNFSFLSFTTVISCTYPVRNIWVFYNPFVCDSIAETAHHPCF